jgi:hypothetical protein
MLPSIGKTAGFVQLTRNLVDDRRDAVDLEVVWPHDHRDYLFAEGDETPRPTPVSKPFVHRNIGLKVPAAPMVPAAPIPPRPPGVLR